MKVAELICDPLDIWVCRAELEEFKGKQLDAAVIGAVKKKLKVMPYWPSRDWFVGGAIIERERIALFSAAGDANEWMAQMQCVPGSAHFGPTALVAAMRCYVWSVYGGEVCS